MVRLRRLYAGICQSRGEVPCRVGRREQVVDSVEGSMKRWCFEWHTDGDFSEDYCICLVFVLGWCDWSPRSGLDRLKYLGFQQCDWSPKSRGHLRGDQPEAGRDGHAAYGQVQDRSEYGGAIGDGRGAYWCVLRREFSGMIHNNNE